MSENWDSLAGEFELFAQKRPRFTAYDGLVNLVRAEGARNLLDYACGPGLFLTDYAAALDIPLTGYDCAASMVTLARQNCAQLKNTHIVDHLQKLEPASFDAISQGFAWVTWESDELCVRYLRECASLLTERGKLYAVVSHPFFRNASFSGFDMRLPEKDVTRDGAPFEVTLYTDGKATTFTDTHWTLTTMCSQAKRAGLNIDAIHEYPDINPERYPGFAFLTLVASRQP